MIIRKIKIHFINRGAPVKIFLADTDGQYAAISTDTDLIANIQPGRGESNVQPVSLGEEGHEMEVPTVSKGMGLGQLPSQSWQDGA